MCEESSLAEWFVVSALSSLSVELGRNRAAVVEECESTVLLLWRLEVLLSVVELLFECRQPSAVTVPKDQALS